MERHSLSLRGPTEGLHPSFSYLPIPARHTSTITLPSWCFKGRGEAAALSLSLSIHPFILHPSLPLSCLGGECLFVFVLLLPFANSRICSFFPPWFLVSISGLRFPYFLYPPTNADFNPHIEVVESWLGEKLYSGVTEKNVDPSPLAS